MKRSYRTQQRRIVLTRAYSEWTMKISRLITFGTEGFSSLGDGSIHIEIIDCTSGFRAFVLANVVLGCESRNTPRVPIFKPFTSRFDSTSTETHGTYLWRELPTENPFQYNRNYLP